MRDVIAAGTFVLCLDFCLVIHNVTPSLLRPPAKRFTRTRCKEAVKDNLLGAYLFNIEMIPRWSEEYVPLMTIGQFDIPLPIKKKQTLI